MKKTRTRTGRPVRQASRSRRTKRFLERLEARLLLNADWDNPGQRLDVNNDNLLTPFDALAGINRLNAIGPVSFGPRDPASTDPYYDANADGVHSPFDVLVVINAINADLLILSAHLEEDSGPQPTGAGTQDRLTNNGTTVVTVATGGEATLRAGFGDTAPADFVTVPLSSRNQFTLTETLLDIINGEPLPDGTHTLRLLADDGIRAARVLDFEFSLDRIAPTATIPLVDTERESFDTLDVTFDQPLDVTAFIPQAFRMEITSGPQAGQTIPIESVQSINNTAARLRFAAPLPDQAYHFEISAQVTDAAGNPITPGSTIKQFAIVDPAAVVNLSPAAGDRLVSLTRETIVRFDQPVDPATVTPESFHLIANGQRVPGRIVVSSTERFATFFYDTPLPASTEVRVVVDGAQIIGRDGLPLDANGDQEPGGKLQADFRTLPLTRIQGTNVFGFVRDSLTGDPIVGATIRVDAFPAANEVTDSNGRFELKNLPAPDVFVHIDGSTANNAPAGFAYPNVGKPFHTIPGQTVQLTMAGVPFDIFLPPMALGDVQPLSENSATDVGFGDAGTAELARMFPELDPSVFAAMAVTFNAGSAVNDQGDAATEAVVIPVPPDRIPAPLPANLNPALVVSIQAAGATNFDVPAAVAFPNLDGLLPGEKTLIYSFDHDAGRWTVVGTGTVSTDGLSVVSDGGVIRAPGWHLTVPGTELDPDVVDGTADEVIGTPGIITVQDRAVVSDFNGSQASGEDALVAFAGDGTMQIRLKITVAGAINSPGGRVFLNVDNRGPTNQFPFSGAQITAIDGRQLPVGERIDFGPTGAATIEQLAPGTHTITISGIGVREEPGYEKVTFHLDQPGFSRASFSTALVANRRPISASPGLNLPAGVGVTDGIGSSFAVANVPQLVDRFRPTLHFDRDPECVELQSCAVEERYMPTSVDSFISTATNPDDLRPSEPVATTRPLIRTDVGHAADFDSAIDIPGDNNPEEHRRLTNGTPPDPTIYSSVVYDGANQIAIHYWFFYAFSNWNEEGGANNHEGDWESITVFLRRPDSTQAFAPEAVGYSQHVAPFNGIVVDWATAIGAGNTIPSPQVYVARGAHASYPTPGTTQISTPLHRGEHFDEHRGGGVVWSPDSYKLAALEFQSVNSEEFDILETSVKTGETRKADWLLFPGRWGQVTSRFGQFGDDGPRSILFNERQHCAWQWGRSIDRNNVLPVGRSQGECDSPDDSGNDSGAGEHGSPSVFDVLQVTFPQNFGGTRSGRTTAGTLTLANTSGATQNLISLEIAADARADFSLQLPAPVSPVTPLTLAAGETLDLPISFHPSATGLRRGALHLRTDHTTDDSAQLNLVGTGIPANGNTTPQFGDDFVALIMPANTGLPVIRVNSNLVGDFNAQIPAETFLQYQVFDPATGLIGAEVLTTSPTGQTTRLPIPGFAASTAADQDGDGLPDDIEFTIGTRLDVRDSDDDGVDDFTEIQSGLNPLDGIAFPVGVIAAIDLAGPAKEVVVEQLVADARQMAFVATGTHGLAIIDASRFDQPIVLGQLDLPGDATDIAVDLQQNIAAVAANAGGLHLVDFTDPMVPQLIRTVAMEAAHVEVVDGVAYVASGGGLRAVDVGNGELLETLTLDETLLTGLAAEGSRFYTMDEDRTLRTIDAGGWQLAARGSLKLAQGGGRLFVGGGVAYVPGEESPRGGYVTVDVSNADLPALISLSDVQSPLIAPRTDVVANGSGLALLVGSVGGVDSLDVLDASDPNNTNDFLTRTLLPDDPFRVAVGAGIAFVATGGSGLQVVNYLPFDSLGEPPQVTIQAGTADLDPAEPGLQVLEGDSVPILVEALDDVQVRSVELLVDDQVIATDVSFPFDFNVAVPALAGGNSSLDVRVRATDTGGNPQISAPITLQVVPDTFPPELVQVTPGQSAARLEGHQTVRVVFSEPMDSTTLSTDNIRVASTAAPDTPLVPVNTRIRRGGRELELTLPPLAVGEYEVTVDTVDLTDLAGNAVGGPMAKSTFVIFEDRDPGETIATALDLGILNGPLVFTERIGEDAAGNPDTADVLTFQLERPAALSTLLSNLSLSVSMAIYQVGDGDHQLDFNERLDRRTPSAGSQSAFSNDLPAGTYHLLIERSFGTQPTDYTLALNPEPLIVTPGGDPGETIAAARNLGQLTDPITQTHLVGGTDLGDVYTFQLDQATQLTAAFSGLTDSLDIELYSDLDGDGQFDFAERLDSKNGSAFSPTFDMVDDLPPGTYQLRIEPGNSSSNTRYTVRLSATPLPNNDPVDAGETIATARDLGVLSIAQNITDVLGGPDPGDVFTFQLTEAQTVTAVVSNLTDSLRAELYHDEDGDGQFEFGERLNTGSGSSFSTDFTMVDDLPIGTYQLRVAPSGGSSNTRFSLDLSATPLTISDPADPGDTISAARDLGLLSAQVTIADIVGGPDNGDVFIFELNQATALQTKVDQLRDSFRAVLYSDDGDGNLEFNEDLNTDTGGAFDPSFTLNDDLPPGTYQLHVTPNNDAANTRYTLELTPTPIAVTDPLDPGATIATARDLGPISDQTIDDVVGGRDMGDVFTFTLNEARAVTAQLSGLNDSLRAELYVDTDGDGQLELAERLNTDSGSGFSPTFTLADDLPPATYHLQVIPSFSSANTRYQFQLASTAIAVTDPNDPGDTIATARDLGPLTDQTVTDIVGGADAGDVFTFQLAQPMAVTAQLTNFNDFVRAELYSDLDGDGVFEFGERLDDATGGSFNSTINLINDLPAGTYHMRVLPSNTSSNSRYTMQLTSTAITVNDPADPGDVIASARDLGVLNAESTIRDVVGGPDLGDVFRFVLASPTTVTTHVTEPNESIRVELYSDDDGDGELDSNEVLNGRSATIFNSPFVDGLPAGTYYWRVRPTSRSSNTRFQLQLTPSAIGVTDPADPGDTIATARNLGSLTSSQEIVDVVGGPDEGDVFTFTLGTSGTFTAQVNDVNERLRFELYRDDDGDGEFDSGERLESLTVFSSSGTLMEDVAAGTFHLRALPSGSSHNSVYRLTLSRADALHADQLRNSPAPQLDQTTAEAVLHSAIERYAAIGVDRARLDPFQVQIADLAGTKLGVAAANTIWLDTNAAGAGWFVDVTPETNEEFDVVHGQEYLVATAAKGAAERMDLLTVVLHELGHLLDLPHGLEDDEHGLMAPVLSTGTRRLLTPDEFQAGVDEVWRR